MGTLNISLPPELREYVERQAEAGHYTTSEYVRQLIRVDRERRATESETLLAEYLDLCLRQADAGDVSKKTPRQIAVEERVKFLAAQKRRPK